jgi:hypothetical protein
VKGGKKPKETRAEKKARKASVKAAKKAAKKAPASRSQTLDESGLKVSKVPVTIDTDDSKGSSVARQAEDYAGAGMGSHTPAHKGSEVLIESDSGIETKQDVSTPHFRQSDPKTVVDSNVIDQKSGGPSGDAQLRVDGAHGAYPGGGEMEFNDNFQLAPLEINLDPNLWRHARILVPVDVQALVVNEDTSGSSWADLESTLQSYCVDCTNHWRFEFTIAACPQCSSTNLETINKPPEKYTTKSSGRAKGIHLHWAMPDALTHGEPKDDEDDVGYMNLTDMICLDCGNRWSDDGVTQCSECSSGNVLTAKQVAEQDIEIPNESDSDRSKGWHEMYDFPQLPDRWLVVRTWPKLTTTPPIYAGPANSQPARYSWDKWNHAAWVIESDTLEVTPLSSWNKGPSFQPPASPSQEMTAVGPATGDPTWTVTYDNAEGRFTFYDEPHNIRGPLNYFVSGWYSDKTQDPLWCNEHTLQKDWWKKMDEYSWSVDKTLVEEYVNSVMEKNGVPWYKYTQMTPYWDNEIGQVKDNNSAESNPPLYSEEMESANRDYDSSIKTSGPSFDEKEFSSPKTTGVPTSPPPKGRGPPSFDSQDGDRKKSNRGDK